MYSKIKLRLTTLFLDVPHFSYRRLKKGIYSFLVSVRSLRFYALDFPTSGFDFKFADVEKANRH